MLASNTLFMAARELAQVAHELEPDILTFNIDMGCGLKITKTEQGSEPRLHVARNKTCLVSDALKFSVSATADVFALNAEATAPNITKIYQRYGAALNTPSSPVVGSQETYSFLLRGKTTFQARASYKDTCCSCAPSASFFLHPSAY
jgi:hypothetical protein